MVPEQGARLRWPGEHPTRSAWDASAIAGVHVRSRKVAYRGLVPDEWIAERTLQRRTAMWHQLLGDSERSRVLVALSRDIVVGFRAAAIPSRDEDAGRSTAEITALYIDPPHWRNGTGRTLLRATLDGLAGGLVDIDDVTLWVFEANERARRFYTHMGFRPDGARAGEPTEPAEVRLRRRVATAV
jgi:GNAT superfamily N-acetyltransferase